MSKNLVLLTPGFPKDEKDSTIIPALQIYVKKLKEVHPDLKLKIIAFQYPFSGKDYEWHGIDVITLRGANKKRNKIFIWYKVLRTLKAINKKERIDIIHSFWLRECSFVGRLFTKNKSIKHIITAMGQDVLSNNRYVTFCSKNALIVTLSHFQAKLLKENYGIESKVIPWGIDTNEFPEVEEKTIDILGVGSLNEVKNYPLFIELIQKLCKRGMKINVEILGGGTQEQEVMNQIENSGLKNIIKLSGEIRREEVLMKMAKAKVLLHTSTFESFGMVFIEAQYSGMNIVSNNVGIAQNSSSWYVSKDEQEMEYSLIKALESENKREFNFDVTNTTIRYKEIYEN